MSDEIIKPKICKDCKFYERRSFGYDTEAYCNAAQEYTEPDIIHGHTKAIAVTCKARRDIFGKCGPQGVLFEPINSVSQPIRKIGWLKRKLLGG